VVFGRGGFGPAPPPPNPQTPIPNPQSPKNFVIISKYLIIKTFFMFEDFINYFYPE